MAMKSCECYEHQGSVLAVICCVVDVSKYCMQFCLVIILRKPPFGKVFKLLLSEGEPSDNLVCPSEVCMCPHTTQRIVVDVFSYRSKGLLTH